MTKTQEDITRLLADWGQGDEAALDRVMTLLYRELRKIAARHLRREGSNHTLQPTALVNEAYLRLVGQRNVPWQNRSHFLAIAARVMRHLLVDYARAKHRARRGGGEKPLQLNESLVFIAQQSPGLLAVNDALERLASADSRKARVVELRFFGGLTVEETAEVLHVSPNTVIRDWSLARAWLHRELADGGVHGS